MSGAAMVPCRVCGSTALAPWVRGRDRLTTCGTTGGQAPTYLVSWCAECRCGTTQIAPDGGYSAVAYPDDYYRDVLHVGAAADKSDQLRAVDRAGRVLAGSRVLEIGCGQGDLLCLLRDRGAHSTGVEPSQMARKAAQERGLPVVETLEDLQSDEYDVVLLFDVLEHLPAPLETLQWIAKSLTESGLAVVAVPNVECLECRLLGARWFALELPRHLTHFSPHALDRLAQRAGLSRRRVEYSATSFLGKSFIDSRLIDGWWNGGPPALRGAAGRVFRWLESGLAVVGNRPHVTMVFEGRR